MDEEVEETEEYTRVSPSDIERARELVAEGSLELAEMVKAESVYEADGGEQPPSDVDIEQKIVRVTVSATYDGIFRVEGDPRPRLAYSKYSTRPDGQAKWLNSAVYISDADDLARLQTGFEVGDRIRISVEINWADPNLTTTLISFEKADAPT